jgi:hypothetical protein
MRWSACALVVAALASSGCFNPEITNAGFACDPEDSPACPKGYACVNHRCIDGTAPVAITKTGPPYMGQHTDPGLDTMEDCPDASLEPNDGVALPDGRPVVVTTTPDALTPRLTKMAICPMGANSATRRHDADWFRVDASNTVYGISAELFYEITYGDLDVAIVDASGIPLASDGTAVSDACVAADVKPGATYYVVVVGAYDMDVNRYDIRVRTFSGTAVCP